MAVSNLPPQALLNIAQELLELLQEHAVPGIAADWAPSPGTPLRDVLRTDLGGLPALLQQVDARFGTCLGNGAQAAPDTVDTLIEAVFRQLS